jgi:hypothetical protein
MANDPRDDLLHEMREPQPALRVVSLTEPQPLLDRRELVGYETTATVALGEIEFLVVATSHRGSAESFMHDDETVDRTIKHLFTCAELEKVLEPIEDDLFGLMQAPEDS